MENLGIRGLAEICFVFIFASFSTHSYMKGTRSRRCINKGADYYLQILPGNACVCRRLSAIYCRPCIHIEILHVTEVASAQSSRSQPTHTDLLELNVKFT